MVLQRDCQEQTSAILNSSRITFSQFFIGWLKVTIIHYEQSSHMLMKNIVSFMVVLLLLFASCKEKTIDRDEYIACGDDVAFVSFQTLFTLEKQQGRAVLPGHIARNFIVHDSLMLIETGRRDGQINIVSRRSGEILLSLLNQGNGSEETNQPINFASWVSFYHKNDSLYCNIMDKQRGRILNVNITRSMADGKPYMTMLFPNNRFPIPMFWAKTIGDSVVIYKHMDKQIRQMRKLYGDSAQISNVAIERMNTPCIPNTEEDINVLSSMIVVNPNGDLFAEIPLGMNYLNIYSVDGTYRKTVCMGQEMDRLSDILALPREDRKYNFANAKAYDFGFAVLKHEITNLQYQSNADYLPSVLMFDWRGNPFGEIKSDFKFTRFEIDIDNKQIYVIDEHGVLLQFEVDVDLKRHVCRD